MPVYLKRHNVYIYICGNGVTHIDLEGNAPLLFIHIYTAELAFFFANN